MFSEIYNNCKTGLSAACLLMMLWTLLNISSTVESRAEGPPCNLTDRHNSCQDGCCVRDDFLFTETYCKPYGGKDSNCATKSSDFECPCETGFHCEPNIHGTHPSLFGKCLPEASSMTTTTEVPSGQTTTPDDSSTPAVDENGNPIVG